MIKLETVSPSSIAKFVQCQRQWALNYDQDAKIRTTGVAAERGTLVHRALELWKDPSKAHPQTLEGLQRCFEQACALEGIGETLEVYVTGRALLPKAFELSLDSKVMPMNRTKIWMVEAKINRWFPTSDHPLPILGFIDTLELIFDAYDPKSVIIVVGDYKTGKAKSKDELLDDIQPPIYMAYALYVLKPYLESQGFTVTNVLNVWTYIADQQCVVLTQDDYDLPAVMQYIANISHQMIAAANAYNSKQGEERAAYLHKHEKLNAFCNWCPVRGSCTQIERAFEQRAMIDMFAMGITLDQILEQRDLYALAAREGEDRRREIDRMVRHHMEINGMSEVEANGKIYYEVINRDKVVDPKAIVHAFGTDFVLANGKITQDAIRNQINLLKITQPHQVQAIVDFLDEHTTEESGARYIRSKKAKEPKAPKALKAAPALKNVTPGANKSPI
jgi:hypothetical protein